MVECFYSNIQKDAGIKVHLLLPLHHIKATEIGVHSIQRKPEHNLLQ